MDGRDLCYVCILPIWYLPFLPTLCIYLYVGDRYQGMGRGTRLLDRPSAEGRLEGGRL